MTKTNGVLANDLQNNEAFEKINDLKKRTKS